MDSVYTTDELEALRVQREAQMSEHDKYCSRIGAMPDQQFNQYTDEAISMAERTKAREPQPIKEFTPEETELNALSGSEFNERMQNLGINSSMDFGSLSDAMVTERRRRSNQDAKDW